MVCYLPVKSLVKLTLPDEGGRLNFQLTLGHFPGAVFKGRTVQQSEGNELGYP